MSIADQKNLTCRNNSNQNSCKLLTSIPPELRDLPFAVYPTMQNYNTERFIFNKRFNIFPAAIFIPDSISSLIRVIKVLRKNNLKFSIRSGGHGFEPASLSSGFVIDLRHFNTMKIVNDEVYIGAGVHSDTIVATLGKYNLAIPTGTCGSVAISGLALGGGMGYLSRTFGLTSDAIKSITLLTADSRVIEVNNQSYSDLFWALRGAGKGSYGIVLGMTFKAYHIENTSYFELTWKWDPILVKKIFLAWHEWVETLPKSINPTLVLGYKNGALSVSINGLKVGGDPFVEWKHAFKGLNPRVVIHTGHYAELAKNWQGSTASPFLKVKSLIAFQPISDKAIQLAINYLEQLQKNKARFQVAFEVTPFGGQIEQGDSSFFPRKAFEWWHEVAYWNQQEEADAALASIRQFHNTVVPLVSNYSYSNDVDYDLGKNYLNSYYGNNVNRLIQIKNKYDPNNFFHSTQSIPRQQS